jgi:uncharacterized membrane protein
MRNTDSTRHDAEPLSIALGLFSLALGAAELFAPSQTARLIGVRDTERTRNTLRIFGAREITAGVAILSQPDRAHWMWSRVGGDALDLAWLGRAMSEETSVQDRVGAAVAAVAGVTALDVVAARRLRAHGRRGAANGRDRGVRVEQVVTINRSIDDVYRYWRDFSNLPTFMRHLEEVEVLDQRRSRWKAKAPAGMTVQWEAEIVQEQEGEWIAWRSLPGADVENSGSVRFSPAPGARGTELRVQLEYRPPAGRLGRGVAMLFGEEPRQQIREDLRRFKSLMESGEIALSDGPGLWRAAQPAKRAEQIRDWAGVSR